jgi:integrase
MFADSRDWSCYTDVYLDYTKTSQSPDYLRNKRTIIGAIEQFDVYGGYPDGRRRHELFKRGAYHLLAPEFKFVIDYYCEAEKKRGKKVTTIYTESHNAATFFLSLQQKGIDSLVKITEDAVLSIFISPNETLLKSYSYKKNVTAVLKAFIPYHPEACHRILAFLPALREFRKNIQYLTSEEIQKVKEALANSENSLTFCDKAIGMLALYTGLRGCDIAGMTLDSIDWGRDLIYIIQQKTDFSLELPLTAVVGNAIYDYLTSERPHTESKYLFVSQNKPHNRIMSRSIGNVAARIMKAAGIRQSKGDRKGFHIFRHHLATALLGNGVPQPVISRTLGHTSPESLESYLSADFPHLKECSLSIDCFPVPEGVFSHE